VKIVERLRERVDRPREVERPDLALEIADLRRERDALRVRVGELTAALAARDARIAELEGQKAALEERLRQQAHALYGRKTEQSPQPEAAPPEAGIGPQGRRRGQRRGARGHGRRRYDALPAVHVTHELPSEERVCAHCGLPTYVEVADEEVSTEIDWEVRIRRVVHHRRKYRRTCRCPGGPRFLTAPAPAKLIPKGLFTPRFVAHVAVEKFLLARPLHRVASALAMEGAGLAEGTLVGVLQRVAPLLEPLYAAICARNRQSPHLHVDETRWRRLWAVQAGAMWLWVFQGPDTTVYVVDDSRGHEVVLRQLGLSEGDATARVVTVVCDFMGAYDAACKRTAEGVDLELARCWAHYRRLILDAGRACPDDRALQRWVAQWIEMVDDFFRLHRERKSAQAGAAAFTHADDLLRGCVMEMEEVRERQLRNQRLPKRARSLLTLGQTHWQELTRCLDDLTLPADNNAAERALRGAVVCRKNFYGSGAGWSEKGTTMFWTIFATAAQNDLNPLTFLTSYLTTCAQSGGPPDDLDGFLPWTDTARQRFGGAVAQAPPGRAPG
jgi:transposase